MNGKAHGILIIALAVLAGIWWQKSTDARAKLKVASDSVVAVQRRFDGASTVLLAHVRADSAREAKAERAIRAKDAAVRAAEAQATEGAARLRADLGERQQMLLDSVEAAHAQALAVAEAQRDSALVLFRRAAADRDSLVSLVDGYRAEIGKAVARLREANRTPFLDTKPMRLVTAILAAKGAVDLIQGR